MSPSDLLDHARTLMAAGAERITLTVSADWTAPPRFPSYQVLSVNPSTGERNVSLYAHRLIDYLHAQGAR